MYGYSSNSYNYLTKKVNYKFNYYDNNGKDQDEWALFKIDKTIILKNFSMNTILNKL